MPIFDFQHTCTQLPLPLCSIIGKTCAYNSRNGEVISLKIASPAAVSLVAFIILSVLRLIKTTNKHYSSFSKDEFVLFFQLYGIAMTLELFLISKFITEKSIFIYLTTLQLGFSSTALVSLLIGSITSRNFDVQYTLRSINIARFLCLIYLILCSTFIYMALVSKNGMMLFIFLIFTNGAISIVYIFSQYTLIYSMNGEVWAYGTLSIAVCFFGVSCMFLFYGNSLVAYLSERYLDGLFFFHLFMFCTILMVHKYWLSTTDNEQECADIKDGYD